MPAILSHFPPASNKIISVIVVISPSKPAGALALDKSGYENTWLIRAFQIMTTTVQAKFTEYCQLQTALLLLHISVHNL